MGVFFCGGHGLAMRVSLCSSPDEDRQADVSGRVDAPGSQSCVLTEGGAVVERGFLAFSGQQREVARTGQPIGA